MARKYIKQGAVTDILTVPLEDNFPHVSCAVSFYPDDTYTTPITSGLGGSYAVEGILQGNATYTAFYNSPVDLTIPGAFASAGSPLSEARVVPSGITGATHMRVTFTGNQE